MVEREFARRQAALFLKASKRLTEVLVDLRGREEFIQTTGGERVVYVEGFVVGTIDLAHATRYNPPGWILYPVNSQQFGNVKMRLGEVLTFEECGELIPREGDLVVSKKAEGIGRVSINLIRIEEPF